MRNTKASQYTIARPGGNIMTRTRLLFSLPLFLCLCQAQQPQSKVPEQGYVPEGWYPHEGGLLKYRVAIRFGEEPDTMPDGWKFGRVSAVAVNAKGEVYVFQRGPKADPIVVFDGKGKYLRSFGKGMFGNPHGMRFDHQGNLWVTDNGDHQVMK